ncbi:uncharacterized protein LOC141702002 [Apium graveolens]|uniref:uncharacterized protein LOC141702002 n=1 Tax=Apium graveolens TaxID=4045 RepID=UPI003D78E139
MDRSWLKADRRTQEFKLGVDELFNFVFLNGFKENKISYPCLRCTHSKSWNAQTVKDHLYQYGIDQTYTCWIWHGELNYVQSHVVSEHDTSESSVDPTNMRMGQDIIDDEDISLDSSDFINHVQGENEPLYPGCESFTKMRALVKLYNLKAKHGISDKCFSDVLLLLASMLPEGNRSDHSTWPVLLSIYNLPPWLCMKRKYIMLILLISRPNQPGNDIDVYLQPLIEDLQKLWHGKEVYDAFKKESFILRGILLWTISDYPALGKLSGNIIKGYNACVVCVDKTEATRLATYKKTVVMRYHRWLPRNHPYRRQKLAFDNTVEKLSAPIPLTGEEALERLEYWKFLPVRHTLDVMHIEKNIYDALTGTLLNILGKTKDRESVRIDMAEMGIRIELRPKNPGKKEKLPMASWKLLHKEKKIFCSSLIGMKLPDGFCSNLKGIVLMDTLRLVGMKSHDCHTMLHHLLPIALRKNAVSIGGDLMPARKALPPSLFDVMIHLSVHLVREFELCGPIFLRWMYPFERYMKTFKEYVRNRAHPEGCIAEAYIAEEAVECLVNFEKPTVGLPGRDKNKEKYRPLSGATMIKPSIKDLHQAHLCLLQNSNELAPYFNEHMAFLVARYPLHENDEEWLKNKQNETFPNWFQKKISSEFLDVKSMVSKEVMGLVEGPNKYVPTFSGYKINGVTYNIKDHHETRQVQSSGVCVHADTMLVQGKDKNIEHISDTFYGVITIVLKLPDKFDDQSDDENEGSVEIELENEVDVTMFPTVDEVEEENSSYMRVIQTTSMTPLSETLLLNRDDKLLSLDCKKPKNSNKKKEANMVDHICKEMGDIDLCATVSDVNLVGSNPREWWIDTSATRHVCLDKAIFSSLKSSDAGKKVYMGNSETSTI